MAVLALNRSYSDIRPRRPEGGRDGGRDIEFIFNGEKGMGGVGFRNSVCDSKEDKAYIRKKFKEDVVAARKACEKIRRFVFFTNIDFTPGELKELESIGFEHGFNHVDIYHRERIRMALDGVEGLSIRYQYLSIKLSDAEQKGFFARFGKDLEDIIHGRFDRIEQKLDDIEFQRWQTSTIRSVSLVIKFNEMSAAPFPDPEHFRFAVEFRSTISEKRAIIFGGRDEYLKHESAGYYFGTKIFFWRRGFSKIEESWLKAGSKAYGGVVTGIDAGAEWKPTSPILATEFDGLDVWFRFTKNLASRIRHVSFKVDDYVLIDWKYSEAEVESVGPPMDWPEEPSIEESRLEWAGKGFRFTDFRRCPLKKFENR